ncbi:MAG: Gfo/Idh/MocA family oxidoreductase [Fimbriimonadales bacterium]|nr:Gfo/Idh/MocA family oxidoreductase [Fimbriimonadales bacterium]MDW8052025.1 Gfo/Idh/MocA family oxidoreductase [Armatimonadota bacterium]
MKVGVVGCGNISPVYLRVAQRFPEIEIVAVADAIRERAEARAQEFGIPQVLEVDELIHHPEIEIVLNLTPPKAHAPINRAALLAGKHVYSEKPFGVNRAEAAEVLQIAQERGLYIGCAPDTVLGAGIQTSLKLLREGAIGEPVGASAFMLSPGPEHWHPNPDFFYEEGGGPMLDMGPYYLTALVVLLGVIRRVAAISRITRPTRVIHSDPKRGQTITVETPTHITGAMEFENGAIATVIMSFDVWAHRLPRIEIYGTEGTLGVPDPNGFGGPVLLRRAGDSEWQEVPLTHPYTEQSRSLGLAEMIRAIQEGRPNRLNGQLAYHVLDAMLAFNDSSASGQHVVLTSRCEPPEPMPETGL